MTIATAIAKDQQYINACNVGDTYMIRNLLKKENNMLKTYRLLVKYLNTACEAGHVDIVKILLQYKIIIKEDTIYHAAKGGNVEILNTITTILTIDNRYEHINHARMKGACEGGHLDIVKIYAASSSYFHYINKSFWNTYLPCACSSGNIELVKYFIEKGASNIDNKSYMGGCMSGNMEIINLLIEKGASHWGYGMIGGCKSGNLEIVNFNIAKGATNWETGLTYACIGGHVEIAELMIKNGASNFNWCMTRGCKEGNIEITKLMIKHGANGWNWGLHSACVAGYVNIVELMLSYGATFTNSHFQIVCERGHIDILKLMLDYKGGGGGGSFDINKGLMYACIRNRSKLYLTITESTKLSANISHTNALALVYDQNIEVVRLLLSKGANSFECLWHLEDFHIYRLYCKFADVCSLDDSKYLHLLLQFPAYIVLIISKTRKSCLSRLPTELLRLLCNY